MGRCKFALVGWPICASIVQPIDLLGSIRIFGLFQISWNFGLQSKFCVAIVMQNDSRSMESLAIPHKPTAARSTIKKRPANRIRSNLPRTQWLKKRSQEHPASPDKSSNHMDRSRKRMECGSLLFLLARSPANFTKGQSVAKEDKRGPKQRRRRRAGFFESRLCHDPLRLPIDSSFIVRSTSMMPRESPDTSRVWGFRTSTARLTSRRQQEACMDTMS